MPRRSLCVVGASIIAASKPVPAITLKVRPLQTPVSIVRRSPLTIRSTRSSAGVVGDRHRRGEQVGRPVGRAPPARRRVPTTACAAARTVPSPPHARTTSAPCFKRLGSAALVAAEPLSNVDPLACGRSRRSSERRLQPFQVAPRHLLRVREHCDAGHVSTSVDRCAFAQPAHRRPASPRCRTARRPSRGRCRDPRPRRAAPATPARTASSCAATASPKKRAIELP